jgi:tetratricopeptide (TPR) repeat protein
VFESSRAWLLAGLFVLSACGHAGDDRASATAGAASEAAPAASAASALVPAQRARGDDLTRLRRALDHGRGDEARALLARHLAPDPEEKLLEARVAALEGRNTDAMRAIEAARQIAPRDPTVYATAAEIYAANGSTETAMSQIFQGEKTCGPSPEFLRARGILRITSSGGAEKGLALLEEARAADPEIPFIDRALGQAHLLVAKQRAREKKPKGALEEAKKSLEFDPDDVDARRLSSEMMAETGDLEGSAAVLQSLLDAGEPVEAELALTLKNAAMLAILRGDQEQALADFLAARKHGLTAQELGTGANKLASEAERRLDLGIQAYEKQELDAAESEFRRALEYDPDLIQAQNHLAVVLFKKREFAEAARLWQKVIATARAEKIDLPEPVHLNLAKAQVQSGDKTGAELTLEEYLDRQPNGEWVAPTREMLASLSGVEHPR